MPVLVLTFRRNDTTSSPLRPSVMLLLDGPTGENDSFAAIFTSTFPTPSSRAKTVTGTSTSSSVETTRGMVACTSSGFFTATSFSAAPNARPFEAMTITRTSPK